MTLATLYSDNNANHKWEANMCDSAAFDRLFIEAFCLEMSLSVHVAGHVL